VTTAHPGVATGVLDLTGSTTAAQPIVISPPVTGTAWVISQLAVSNDAGSLMFLSVEMNGLPCMTPTLVQSGAAADGDPPLSLGSHVELQVNVSQCAPSAKVTVSYFYEEVGE